MNSRNQSQQLLQMDELQREFDLQQFLAVIEHLLNALSLHFDLNIKELYNSIKLQHGRVIGRDILKLLHLLKEENTVQKQLDDQIYFYRSTIQQIVSKGKYSLTIGQFFVIFIMNNPKKGIVTDEIHNKVSQYKIVSMQKLLGLIQSIERTRSQTKILKSNPSNLILNYQKDNQIHLKCSQFQLIQQLRSIILQNCADQSKNSVSVCLIQKIKKKLIQNLEYIQKLQQFQRLFHTKQQKINQQFLRLEQIIIQKQDEILKLCEKNQIYQKQIQIFQEKCREDFIETIQKLGQENSKLLVQRNQALRYYEQIVKELEWFKINYQQSFNKYQQYIQKEKDQDKVQFQDKITIESRQVQNKLRLGYILQTEAKQNYENLTKLRMQNLELKRRICDLQAQIEARAQADARALTSGHQTDRTFKNLTLDERVFAPVFPNHEQAKQTFLQLLRKKQYLQQIEEQISKSILLQKSNSIQLIRNVTNQYFKTQSYKQEVDQKQQYNIQTNLQTQCELNKKLYQFDFIGILNSKIFQDLTNYIESSKSVNVCKKIFSSYVSIITSNSTQKKQKVAFIMSSNKLLFCTAKNLQKKFVLQIGNLKQLCFCENVRDLIILRTKQTNINYNNNQINQLIISMNKRDELLKYFIKTGFLNKQSSFKISFEDEEKIQIKQKSRSINLSHFLIMKNLVQNSVNDGQNVFEAKIHYLFTFFNTAIQCIMLINPIGIMMFEAGKNSLFQKFEQNPKLKFILPFCKNMEIIDLSQQNKIKLVYPTTQKSYVIQLTSYGEAKLVKQKIKKQKYKIAQYNKKRNDQYLKTFVSLRKMRSIKEQQSTVSC